MFFYAKKIVYLSIYERNEKLSSAGFASLQGERDELWLRIQIKNAAAIQDGRYPIFLITEEQEVKIGELFVKMGCGTYEKRFLCASDKLSLGGCQIDTEEISAVTIRLSEEKSITGILKPVRKREEKQLLQMKMEESLQEGAVEEASGPVPEQVFSQPAQEQELKAVAMYSDKWEQLKSQYKIIHPFGDEREFISIEPKDFVVLREAYQRLVNNSFLLHGFYNYRHLVLGKDYKIGTNSETCFYLGVPGVFFEREKMVAVMFGFEGFESAGAVEIGKFGYYLRRVEI